MITLSYKKAHDFVEKQQRLGNDVEWQGWDMVFFSPNPKAVYVGVKREGSKRTTGAYRAGAWGYETRISPNSSGKWTVPNRNAKFIRRTRA